MLGMVYSVFWAVPKKHLRKGQPSQNKLLVVHAWGITSLHGKQTIAWSNIPSLLFSNTEKGWEFKSPLVFAEKTRTKATFCYPGIIAAGATYDLLFEI